jgi:DegV family protein with EDD domain
MQKVALVTDSTAYLPRDLVKRFHITVVPQVLIWGEKMYEDGVNILPEEFYRRLAESKTMPTTSQVSVANMHRAFQSLTREGFDVLGMFLSEKLSGTFQSAVQGRELLDEGRDKIHLLDTNTTTMAMGFQVLAVARAAAQGATVAECKALAARAKETTGVYFVVDTLEFLHRGGRIGGAQRLLGTALNLKPLLSVRDGRVEAVERIRTKAKAMDRLVDIVVEQCKGKTPIRLATLHANSFEDAKSMVDAASRHLDVAETIYSEISPVVGTHTGPGTVGIAYMAGL